MNPTMNPATKRADDIVNRTMFTADCLEVMRGMVDESIDLIYLDPPFNSKRIYHAPTASKASGASFNDVWKLDAEDLAWLERIEVEDSGLAYVIDGIGCASGDSAKSYCIYMAIRLLEMRRLLKSTGSIYYHCDPTMSHAVKLLLDVVFGRDNFRSEITWPRYAVHSLAKGFDNVTDSILLYSNSGEPTSNPVLRAIREEEKTKLFPHIEEETGRHYQHVALEQASNSASAGEVRIIGNRKVTSETGWRWTQETFDERLFQNPYLIYWTKSGRPRYKIYADEYKGHPVGNCWSDIPYLSSNASERTGYPTQKPLALLKRVVESGSDEGDWVLDPFCGCATACLAAEALGRQWIGIDVSEVAFQLVKMRLKSELTMVDGGVINRVDPPLRAVKEIPFDYKKLMYERQNALCNGCRHSFPLQNLAIDHVVPRRKGGQHTENNLQLLCSRCNSIKGNRDMKYLLARLGDEGLI